jgi:hypothetical protein
MGVQEGAMDRVDTSSEGPAVTNRCARGGSKGVSATAAAPPPTLGPVGAHHSSPVRPTTVTSLAPALPHFHATSDVESDSRASVQRLPGRKPFRFEMAAAATLPADGPAQADLTLATFKVRQRPVSSRRR